MPGYHLYFLLRDRRPQDQDYEDYGHFNPSKAREFLEKAKASLSDNELIDLTVRINVPIPDSVLQRLAEEISRQLSEAGIATELGARMEEANAWVITLGWFNTPYGAYMALHSREASKRMWRYSNPYVDHLLDKINNEGISMDVYREIQKILTTERLFLPLFRQGTTITHTRDLDTKSKLRVTNALYGPDVVHWEFK